MPRIAFAVVPSLGCASILPSSEAVSPMTRHRRILLTLATTTAALAGSSATALTQSTQSGNCTATFHVQHNDRIGNLRLPAGSYRISTVAVSCLRASHLFIEFLNDWNGVLPRPWRYRVNAVGDGTFNRGTGGASFRVVRQGNFVPGSPGHATDGGGNHGSLACPGTFEVQNNDRIGALRIPRGDYILTRLGVRIPCGTLTRLFARFLEHPDGRLPGGWVVLPAHAEFVKGSTRYGFQIEGFAD
jgi:hypothetical protein